ncbi:centrosomal protein of 131 kDa-like [Actinia tenebrosa]|uniref:Centrosomal protein of 131 kDa-like n=1 Tax=Actinia tenebrosa TaxID=6105 RepID=A0A6P8J4Z8_ACTTE|nr:centrosomal protein of 131 kDa-like [Actinia tenebrosa]
MASKKSFSTGSLGNTRPTSAKGTRTSGTKGKLSSRSNISNADSEFSDLSITGSQKKVAKKTEQHRNDVRSSVPGRPLSDMAGSDSDRTTSSSGARSKTYNVNEQGNMRYSEGKTSSGRPRSKHKRDLASVFKNKPPDLDSCRPESDQLPTEDIDDWWPGSNHVPKVPPLHNLISPSEEKDYNWWDNLNDDQPHDAAQNHWPKDMQHDPLVDALNDMLNSPANEGNKNDHGIIEGESKESPVPKLKFGNLSEDDSGSVKQNAAAIMIQKWYRGWSVRRKTGKSAVKRILGQKKVQKERQSFDHLGSMEAKEAEKAKRREEKARLARQAAIKELQNKREEKRQENQRKAEEEIVFLQSSGVISKKKSSTKQKPKATGTKRNNNQSALNNSPGVSTAAGRREKDDNRPATGSSTARKLDELFQEDVRTIQVAKSTAITEDTPETDRTESTIQNVKSEGASKSTFEDLLESLKQLEQQPENPSAADSGSKYDEWVEQLTARMDDGNKQRYLSAENLDQLSQNKTDTENGAALSAEKLQTIINFLDEVEKAEEITLSEIHQSREEAISRGLTSPSANIDEAKQKEREEARSELVKKEMAALESMSANAADVTNAMMAMKIELEEKKRTNELLQRALNQQRDFSLRQGKESEKDAKQRLAIQKQEYEATIQRHLTFIDQLIDDKKILGERCEELLSKMKTVDKKYTDKIKTLEENHAVEMKKQKEVIMAAEKLRREKWIAEKTQQIKEVTVKGLEPDIQKLIAKHKAELKKLRSSHQAELLEADERAGRRYIQQIEELREQLEREKENACTKERELAQQRLEKQMEQEEQAYQQQRRRLYSDLQEEKERMAAQAQRQRQELDETVAELQESHKTVLAELQRSHEKAIADIENKHQFEMRDLKEKLEIEKQAWIENYMKKQDAVLLTKERELKEGVREARDREIEMVITRLEEETAASREECERAAENRIKRIRNKYESEMKELERSESNMQQKCNSLKEQLLEAEGEVTRLRSQHKQITHQKEDVEKVLSKLQEERGKVADIIRQEFADRLITTEEDNKRLKTEVSEMRARHRLDTDRITREKEQEMEQLHQRVKQAISRKDETVKALQEQQQAAMKRADHLELLLQQQRKKLLP